jgi:hypothetical protein
MGESKQIPSVIGMRSPAPSVQEIESASRGVEIAADRLSTAHSPDEAILAVIIMGEVKRQDLQIAEFRLGVRQFEERTAFDRRQQCIDAGLRLSALLLGGGLVLLEHAWVGGFVMAAGLYAIAKDFVLQKFPGPHGPD